MKKERPIHRGLGRVNCQEIFIFGWATPLKDIVQDTKIHLNEITEKRLDLKQAITEMHQVS